jgi:hypothetical protein
MSVTGGTTGSSITLGSLGLVKYSDDEVGWGTGWNGNMDTIDAAISSLQVGGSQVQADWDATSGLAEILNKPDLAPVATSGDYADLVGVPALPHNFSSQPHLFLNGYNAILGVFSAAQATASDVSGLAPIAISGSYNDLTNKPVLPATQVAVPNRFFTAYSATTGLFTEAQPTALDVSGLAAVATSGSYTDLINKPVLAANSPAVAHQFLTSYDNITGAFTKAQPGAADVSGLAPSATIDTTNALNITSGTLAVARLPVIPATQISGLALVATSGSYLDLSNKPVLAATIAATPNNFLTAYNAVTGIFTKGQPAATDVTGLATVATTGSYTDLINKPILPVNTGSTPHQFFIAYDNTTGGFLKAQPAAADVTGLATVATSGSYNDLTNKPVLSTVAGSGSYLDLTHKPTYSFCPGTTPGTVFVSPGAVIAVTYNGTVLPRGVAAPKLSYTLAGDNVTITLNFTAEAGDRVDAFCTT